MRTLTGKRIYDIGLFILGFAFLAHLSEAFRVYHKETRCEVALVAVTPDGTRTDLETPSAFSGRQRGLFSTMRRIRSFVQTDAGGELIPANGWLEWSLHYRIKHGGNDTVWQLRTPETEELVDD